MKNTISRHHGIALLLVLTAIGVATLIGVAMLNSASLQAQVGGSAANGVVADFLADSAVQTASYYLQRNLAGMPASWGTTSGHTIKASSVTVSGVTGNFDIDVVPTAVPDKYTITATGRSGGASPMTRTVTVTIKAIRSTPTYAAGFGGPVTVLARNFFNGAAAVVNGAITTSATANFATGINTSFSSSQFTPPATAAGNINYYGADVNGGSYTMPDGTVGYPQSMVASGPFTLTSSASLVANANNPGRVFYFPGNLTITAAGTYSGTLISRGTVSFSTPNPSTVTITRQAGFPALIADGKLNIPAGTRNLTLNLNGVVWLGMAPNWGGTSITMGGTQVNVNGALLMPGSQTLAALPSTTALNVNYTSANVDVLNLTTAVQPCIGVKFISWQQ